MLQLTVHANILESVTTEHDGNQYYAGKDLARYKER